MSAIKCGLYLNYFSFYFHFLSKMTFRMQSPKLWFSIMNIMFSVPPRYNNFFYFNMRKEQLWTLEELNIMFSVELKSNNWCTVNIVIIIYYLFLLWNAHRKKRGGGVIPPTATYLSPHSPPLVKLWFLVVFRLFNSTNNFSVFMNPLNLLSNQTPTLSL